MYGFITLDESIGLHLLMNIVLGVFSFLYYGENVIECQIDLGFCSLGAPIDLEFTTNIKIQAKINLTFVPSKCIINVTCLRCKQNLNTL